MQNLDHSASSVPAGTEDPSSRRACDQCRSRKIRCDKDWPCSNCRTSKRPCTTSGPGQRPREPRQRVLISSQYERKIDQIEDRLGNIEILLQKLVSSGPQSSVEPLRLPHTPKTGSSVPTAPSTILDDDDSDDESALGGDSGFTAQTAFASEFLEHAVERTSLQDVSPSIEAALLNLRQIVDMQKQRSISHGPRFPLQQPVPEGGLSKLLMPPLEAVVILLKKLKAPDTPPSLFTFTCAIVGLVDFPAMCQAVYFATDDFSDSIFAIVNSGLYNLFAEQASLTVDPALRNQYQAYTRLCQANLETCLANLPLFLPPKIEVVQTLFLGVLYSIDVSRPSVAWHLNSTAAQLCQTGGFHRKECIDSDPPQIGQIKTILFWHVYTMDKGLGLRLGRASVIQDCDISIERDFNFSGFMHLEMSSIPKFWLATSSLQGRLYEQLYSPAALAAPPTELISRAKELAVESRILETDVLAARDETVAYLRSISSSEIIDVFIKGDEVQFHVTICLVYRAIPAPVGSSSRFCDECLDAARKAFQAHHEGMDLVDHGAYVKSIYVHWALMLTPFAPFFVLFCHVIETLSMDDLKILHDFVASLEKLRDASQTAEKLVLLYQVMCDVAVKYLEAKSQQQQDQSMVPIGHEFDMYLNQLGFMPTDDQLMDDTSIAQGMLPEVIQTGQMADWFQGSRAMFGLLEEDLSHIDPGRGMQPGSHG